MEFFNLISTVVEVLHMSCTFKFAVFLKIIFEHLRLHTSDLIKHLPISLVLYFHLLFLPAPTSETPCNILWPNADKGQEVIKTS